MGRKAEWTCCGFDESELRPFVCAVLEFLWKCFFQAAFCQQVMNLEDAVQVPLSQAVCVCVCL